MGGPPAVALPASSGWCLRVNHRKRDEVNRSARCGSSSCPAVPCLACPFSGQLCTLRGNLLFSLPSMGMGWGWQGRSSCCRRSSWGPSSEQGLLLELPPCQGSLVHFVVLRALLRCNSQTVTGPFKVYSPVIARVSADLYTPRHCLIAEHLHQPKKQPCTY